GLRNEQVQMPGTAYIGSEIQNRAALWIRIPLVWLAVELHREHGVCFGCRGHVVYDVEAEMDIPVLIIHAALRAGFLKGSAVVFREDRRVNNIACDLFRR